MSGYEVKQALFQYLRARMPRTTAVLYGREGQDSDKQFVSVAAAQGFWEASAFTSPRGGEYEVGWDIAIEVGSPPSMSDPRVSDKVAYELLDEVMAVLRGGLSDTFGIEGGYATVINGVEELDTWKDSKEDGKTVRVKDGTVLGFRLTVHTLN